MGFCDVGVQSLIVKVLSDGLDPVKGDLIEVFWCNVPVSDTEEGIAAVMA